MQRSPARRSHGAVAHGAPSAETAPHFAGQAPGPSGSQRPVVHSKSQLHGAPAATVPVTARSHA